MELKKRRIVHTGVTKYPTDEWTAQPLREATPWGKGSKYLIRDRVLSGGLGGSAERSAVLVGASSNRVIGNSSYQRRAP